MFFGKDKPMQIVNKPVKTLIPYANNARTHSTEQVKQIAASIKEFGFTNPVLIDGENGIIAGHGRVMAAELLKMDEVPCIELPHLTKAQKKAYIIADNKLALNAGWDIELLKTDFAELQELDFDLSLTGFNDIELSDIFRNDEAVEDDFDVDAETEAIETPVSKLGDIWQLGNHRLMCGDSTDKETVAKLMDGNKADMIFTDPPYNVDYGVSKKPRHKIRTIENDKQTPEEWELFCNNLFLIFKEYNNGDIYMWGASGPEGMRMRLWLIDSGCHWSATIVWKKNQLVLSPAKYQRMYEPCFYGWFEKSGFQADRKQTEVWEIDRPRDSKLHPTMKPIALCEKGIQNSSNIGQGVLDLFGGSGSTLIACEQTNRNCYMMELDEKYCDVIIKRWETLTGKKAVLINGS